MDTSALFAAVYSITGGANLVLALGEAEAVSVLASTDVLAEAEEACGAKLLKLSVCLNCFSSVVALR